MKKLSDMFATLENSKNAPQMLPRARESGRGEGENPLGAVAADVH